MAKLLFETESESWEEGFPKEEEYRQLAFVEVITRIRYKFYRGLPLAIPEEVRIEQEQKIGSRWFKAFVWGSERESLPDVHFPVDMVRAGFVIALSDYEQRVGELKLVDGFLAVVNPFRRFPKKLVVVVENGVLYLKPEF